MSTPGLFLITLQGPLISPPTSLTGLRGAIRHFWSVMNLFSFSKGPCCLLNHCCSTWATISVPTAALVAQSAADTDLLSTYLLNYWPCGVYPSIFSFSDVKSSGRRHSFTSLLITSVTDGIGSAASFTHYEMHLLCCSRSVGMTTEAPNSPVCDCCASCWGCMGAPPQVCSWLAV